MGLCAGAVATCKPSVVRAGLHHRAGILDGSLGTVGEPPEGSCSSHPGSDVDDQLAGP